MSIVVAYRRVSSLGQVNNGDSLEHQKERISGWCKFMSLPEPVDFCDAGISGATADGRPAFMAAVKAVLEAGPGSTFIVYKLDRAGRNAIDVQEVVSMLLDSKIRVVAIADGVDSASGMGEAVLKLLISILSAFAELEKSNINLRTSLGQKRAKDASRRYCREPEFGKMVDPENEGAIIDCPRELDIIDRIQTLRNAGHTIGEILNDLEANKIAPRRGNWSRSTIHKIATGKKRLPKSKTSARLDEARQRYLENG